MKCPICKNILKIPLNTELNMSSYGRDCLTITNCCGQLVNTRPNNSYKVSEYKGNLKEDDWGRKVTKLKTN